ncbi:MAG: CPBP family intramembrane metalloprotease [Chloroflexi bacterium]|nr:CPBP family intramembrane metalloprotease [Chloroflexota bacterium]
MPGPSGAATPVTWLDALGGYIAGIGGGYVLAIALLPFARQHPLARLLPNYLAHCWMLAVALCWLLVLRRTFPVGPLSLAGLRGWRGPLLTLTALVMLLSFGQVGRMAGTPPLMAIETVLFQAVLVGVAEEFVMRGIVQTGLNHSIAWVVRVGAAEFKGGTILAALLFALTHLVSLITQPLDTVLGDVLLAFPVGLLLGYFYDHTHNVWGAIIGHNIVDGLSTIIGLL